jgi:choline dehydrogenase
MLSGIGPYEQLLQHAIPLVANLPGVGAHLMDHVCTTLLFRDSSGVSLNYLIPRSLVDVARTIGAAVQWLMSGTGPFTSNVRTMPDSLMRCLYR